MYEIDDACRLLDKLTLCAKMSIKCLLYVKILNTLSSKLHFSYLTIMQNRIRQFFVHFAVENSVPPIDYENRTFWEKNSVLGMFNVLKEYSSHFIYYSRENCNIVKCWWNQRLSEYGTLWKFALWVIVHVSNQCPTVE